jgi:hypothetical protein
MTPNQNRGAGKRRPPVVASDYYENKAEQRETKLFYVFYNGKVTEKNYFEGLRNVLAHQNKTPSQFVQLQYTEGTPQQIVESVQKEINERKQEGNKVLSDKIWLVFDKDDFDNYSYAVSTAISVWGQAAYSNVCFELWLLLHFQDVNAETEFRRSALTESLRNLLEHHTGKPSGSKDDVKHLSFGFLLTHGKKDDAIKRSEFLFEKAKEKNPDAPWDVNPVTNVYSLVKDLEMFFSNTLTFF